MTILKWLFVLPFPSPWELFQAQSKQQVTLVSPGPPGRRSGPCLSVRRGGWRRSRWRRRAEGQGLVESGGGGSTGESELWRVRTRGKEGEWSSPSVMQGQLSELHLPLPTWPFVSPHGPQHPPLPSLPRGSWLLCFLLATLSLPCGVVAAQTPTVFRVGVLGPWACDPIFAKARPRAAAHLAVQRINRDPSLSLGTTFDFVILDEDCQTSTALDGFMGLYSRATALVGPVNPGYCDTASLMSKTWNKAMFSWACVNYELDNASRHPTFVRTVPSPIRVLLALVRNFRWANMAVIASADDVWTDTASKVADALRSNGFPVRAVLSTGNHPSSMRHTLGKIRKMHEIRSEFFVLILFRNKLKLAKCI